MAYKLPAHLFRNRYGILYFRMAIPRDIRDHFGQAELYISLRTGHVSQAAPAAQALAVQLKRRFCQLRGNTDDPMTSTKLNHLQFDLTYFLDLKKGDKTAKLNVTAEPHEAELAERLIAKTIAEFHSEEQPVSSAPTFRDAVLFSQLAEDYSRAKQAQGKWEPKTVAENEAVYQLFIAIVGDMPAAVIDNDHIVTYLETLRKLPSNLKKRPECQGLTIEEVLGLSLPPMAHRTVNKNIERVSSVFKWALSKKKYGVTHNPAAGMSIDETSAPKRTPFTEQELISLFSSPEFSRRQFETSYAYWLMPLALYTGARLGELCQLSLNDFVEAKGISCISISDEDEGQRLKNENAKRLIPVHSQLVALGLLEHVEALKANGHSRLFPELKAHRDGFAQIPSKWFQRYRARCGIKAKHTKVFHSFRHNFISHLLDSGIEEHSVAQIVGHEANLITGQVYWNDPNIVKKVPTVETFQLPSTVRKLIPRFDEVVLKPRRARVVQDMTDGDQS